MHVASVRPPDYFMDLGCVIQSKVKCGIRIMADVYFQKGMALCGCETGVYGHCCWIVYSEQTVQRL